VSTVSPQGRAKENYVIVPYRAGQLIISTLSEMAALLLYKPAMLVLASSQPVRAGDDEQNQRVRSDGTSGFVLAS
jgi:hypothetical protein